MLLKSTESTMSKARNPSLLPRWQNILFSPKIKSRPSSRCFLFEMEHIKLVCFKDKCLILNPDNKAIQNFINGLKTQFYCKVIQSGHQKKRTHIGLG